MTARVPAALARALESEAEGLGSAALAAAAARLSETYRSARSGSAPVRMTEAERVAYVVARMPATFAAVSAALRELSARAPELAPRSLLDVGAGPGTAAWAAAEVFPSIEETVLVERDPELAELGRRLASDGNGAIRNARWCVADVRSAELVPADLVTASYVINELDPRAASDLARRCVSAARGAFVLVEPGTPGAFERVRAIRSELLGGGVSIVAPCPHGGDCPMASGDWCHFAERVERSALHRRVKGGSLAYEDEKYSYLVAVRGGIRPAVARIIRHPTWRKGHAYVDLCTPEGIRREVVSKHDRELYRAARKSRWGDAWPPGNAAPGEQSDVD